MKASRIVKLLGIPVLVFILSFGLTVGTFLSLTWIDKYPPEILLDLPSLTLKSNQLNFSGSIRDFLSGLEWVKVEFRQGDTEILLLNTQLSKDRLHRFNLVVDEAESLNIRDGKAELVITAQDGSRKRNVGQRVFTVVIDSTPPVIQFVSHPRSVERYKPFLCFYKVQDANLREVFLRDGFNKYVVLRAWEYDETLPEELFVSAMRGSEFVTAVDTAGNVSETPCPVELKDPATPIENSLSDEQVVKDRQILNQILKSTLKSQNRRLFSDVGLRFQPFSVEQVARTVVDDFVGLRWSSNDLVNVKCPSSMRIEKVDQVNGENVLIGDLGLGLRLILLGFTKSFLKEGNLCSPDIMLVQSGPTLRAYLILRDQPTDILGLVSGRFFLDGFVRQSAVAKRAYGISSLSPVESAVLKR